MDMIAATEFLARSSTLTSVGWIGYIIIGAIAGWIAGKIVKGGGSGILVNIVIGIIGALIGGFLLSFFLDTAEGGWWFTLFTAVLGSVILLWIVGHGAAKDIAGATSAGEPIGAPPNDERVAGSATGPDEHPSAGARHRRGAAAGTG